MIRLNAIIALNKPFVSADLFKGIVKYALFNREDLEIWFVQLKAQFTLAGFTWDVFLNKLSCIGVKVEKHQTENEKPVISRFEKVYINIVESFPSSVDIRHWIIIIDRFTKSFFFQYYNILKIGIHSWINKCISNKYFTELKIIKKKKYNEAAINDKCIPEEWIKGECPYHNILSLMTQKILRIMNSYYNWEY